MKDWKPYLNPGYTGRRHDDNTQTSGWISITGIAFYAGIALGVTITLSYLGM